MTFLGKVLVVTLLIFSLVFMAFAGAVYSRQNTWKKQADMAAADLASTKTLLQDEDNAHKDENAKNAAQINTLKQTGAKAEADRDILKASLLDEQKRHQQTTVERNQALALAEVSEKAAAARVEEARVQAELNKKLHAELSARVDQVRQLEKDVFDLQRTDEARTKKHNELLEKLARLEEIIRKIGKPADPEALVNVQSPPPVVEGYVKGIKTDKDKGIDLVEISVGSDDGLAVGHNVYISRGTKYLGQIKIVRVSADRAVGSVVRRAKNGIIEEGDHASTKL